MSDTEHAAVKHLSDASAKRWEAMLAIVQSGRRIETQVDLMRVYDDAYALVEVFEEGEAP